jgi:hypothetical protein
VDVDGGPPVAAAGLLAVVDWHLPDVARDREMSPDDFLANSSGCTATIFFILTRNSRCASWSAERLCIDNTASEQVVERLPMQ